MCGCHNRGRAVSMSRRSQEGRKGVWVCGCVGVWVCGCVGVWVCGCVGGGGGGGGGEGGGGVKHS